MNYAGSNQPLPSQPDPAQVFNQLYGMSASNPAQAAAQQQLRADRKSVLDVNLAELNAVLSKVGSADRQKIQAHLDASRSIELTLTQAAPPSAVCAAAPSAIDLTANESFPALVKVQMDLLVSALKCDRTRVATLQLSHSFSQVVHDWCGTGADHHSLTHDPSATDILISIGRWYAQQMAYLIGALKAIPEGTGTLLDSCLVVFGNELADGLTHIPDPSPVIIAGQCGGAVRVGRFVDYGPTMPYTQSQLLVTLCHAMGLTQINTVGNLGNSGPLPDVLT
jgi:hypothetical protein